MADVNAVKLLLHFFSTMQPALTATEHSEPPTDSYDFDRALQEELKMERLLLRRPARPLIQAVLEKERRPQVGILPNDQDSPPIAVPGFVFPPDRWSKAFLRGLKHI